MIKIVKKSIRLIKRYGFARAIVRIVAKILNVDLEFQEAKNKAWDILCEKYNYEVAYGPFKGMKLNKDIWWSKNDRITQTLGTYEEHILESLIDFRNKGATRLIDIGAADGYFAVGMAYAKIYKNVYAFEIEQQGRYRIAENAYANGCKDSLIIQGEATHSSLAEILDGEKKSTILIDIEGDVYNFLDEKMLRLLRGNYIICELHAFLVKRENFVPNGLELFDDFYDEIKGIELENNLISRASEFFDVSIVKRESYDPNRFEELDKLYDEERLVAIGESRHSNMKWMILTPK